MMKLMMLLTLAFALTVEGALADQITMKNGDRLTGKIVKSDGKTLVIITPYASEIAVTWSEIDQITSDQPLHLTLSDGQTIVGTVTTEPDRYAVETKEAGRVMAARSAVTTVRSSEEQAAYEAEMERLRNPGLLDLWSGAFDAGISLSRGNAETTHFTLGFAGARTTPRDKISVYSAAIYSRDSTNEPARTIANAVRGGIRYDFNIGRKWFAYGFADFEHDEFQELDLRVVLGGGLGYHAIQTERARLDIYGGGALNKEYFDNDFSRTSGELQVGQDFEYKLSGRSNFIERLVFFPNLSEGGEFRINFDAALVTDITSRINWRLTLSDRYLSNPLPGLRKNDLLLSTGVGIKFGRATK
jgi:putative salt-induced outer membrane protein YdiY